MGATVAKIFKVNAHRIHDNLCRYIYLMSMLSRDAVFNAENSCVVCDVNVHGIA